MYHEYHNTMMQERRSRHYAVAIFLPQFLTDIIKSVRERYDPDYRIIDPHLTLVFPFETEMAVDEMAAVIQSVTDKTKLFEVALEDLSDFYPKAPIIYWSVAKNEQLRKLYYDLTTGLKQPLPFSEYVPHVTVAREISDHRVMLVKETICAYISAEKFTAGSIDLITPLADNRWVSVRTFPLRGE